MGRLAKAEGFPFSFRAAIITGIILVLLTIPDWGANILGMFGLMAPYGDWHLITFPWTVVGISVRSLICSLSVMAIVGFLVWILSQIHRYEDPNDVPDEVLDVVGRGRGEYGSSYGSDPYGGMGMGGGMGSMGMGGMDPFGGPPMGGPPMGGGPMF